MEKRFFRRDGSLVWGRLRISLLKQTPRLVIATIEDITEKKTAGEARLRHAAILESSEDAIIPKNLDGVIQSWNASAQRIFGCIESEVVGQPNSILIPPELWHEEQKILERLRAESELNIMKRPESLNQGKRSACPLPYPRLRMEVAR